MPNIPNLTIFYCHENSYSRSGMQIDREFLSIILAFPQSPDCKVCTGQIYDLKPSRSLLWPLPHQENIPHIMKQWAIGPSTSIQRLSQCGLESICTRGRPCDASHISPLFLALDPSRVNMFTAADASLSPMMSRSLFSNCLANTSTEAISNFLK